VKEQQRVLKDETLAILAADCVLVVLFQSRQNVQRVDAHERAGLSAQAFSGDYKMHGDPARTESGNKGRG